jgi:hypothetical protein
VIGVLVPQLRVHDVHELAESASPVGRGYRRGADDLLVEAWGAGSDAEDDAPVGDGV